ncbi:MAG TPA: fibronectin type III domain-containing protein [Candidatus Angelobacter sp.]
MHQRAEMQMLRRLSLILAIGITLTSAAGAQTNTTGAEATVPDHETRAVKITHGPIVELITDSTAQIAWSTNVNAGTLLHYGTDPEKLDHTASMPWGGLTHRVVLKHLNPATTYYFMAESMQGQDTGTQAQAQRSSFKTVAVGEPPVRHMVQR